LGNQYWIDYWIVFSPIGFIIGLFVGAFIGELIYTSNEKKMPYALLLAPSLDF
jgi:uncharacterized protein YqgC (DUF456 family)